MPIRLIKGFLLKGKKWNGGKNKMNNKEQIEIAQQLINNLQDYIELTKVQRKLKVENVEQQIGNIVEFVKANIKEL